MSSPTKLVVVGESQIHTEEMANTQLEIPDEWEFYPCLVDDAPASILLNLWYRKHFEELEMTTLYYGRIEMLEPDEHGMGSKDEADALFAAEDMITNVLLNAGLINVGRLRNTGGWQLTFYGRPNHESVVEEAFAATINGREYATGSKPDADWSYYHEFLYPDRERLQWIANRRQVQTLADHGDDPDAMRLIDHYLYFPTIESRDQFVASLSVNGFPDYEQQEHSGDQTDPFGVQVSRTDPVELGHIHDVVMDLAILAEKFGGDYDGWGAPIVQGEPEPGLN